MPVGIANAQKPSGPKSIKSLGSPSPHILYKVFQTTVAEYSVQFVVIPSS